ncbi:MAG TPA: VOC family protein [Thermomonospora sp.]|nr:VOC family protein [Thermomonospora sp.]
MTPNIQARLIVADVDEAIAYYVSCLGARRGPRHADPSGHVVHAELTVGESTFSLAQAHDGYRLYAPGSLGGSPLLLTLNVDDARAVGAAMVAGGGRVVVPIEDRPYGRRQGRVEDPFGHLWVVSQLLAPAA